MDANVLQYEPHLALFVPDDDALMFYRSIAHYASQALRQGGELYFEINPLYATELQDMLITIGFTSVEIRGDQFGKKRFIKAIKKK